MVWNTGRSKPRKKRPKNLKKHTGLSGLHWRSVLGGSENIDQARTAMIRTGIIFIIALSWFLITPFIFLDGGLLMSFSYYTNWFSNQGTTTYAVYQFWTVVPIVLLFFLGIFWAGGLFGLIGRLIGV